MSKHWCQLGVRRLRAIVPYDVAVTDERKFGDSFSFSSAQVVVRENFRNWYTSIVEYNRKYPGHEIEMAVAFQDHHSNFQDHGERETYRDGKHHAPHPRDGYDIRGQRVLSYEYAFKAFLEKFPEVKVIMPWNEPNRGGGAGNDKDDHGRGNWDVYLQDTNHKLNETCDQGKDGPSPEDTKKNDCGSWTAAAYWRVANQFANGKVLVAGEFAGGGPDGYIAEYKQHIRNEGWPLPKVWGIHPYTDVNRYQANGNSDNYRRHCRVPEPQDINFSIVFRDPQNKEDSCARTTKNFIDQIDEGYSGEDKRKFKIWLTEIGAEQNEHYDEDSQARATAFILNLSRVDDRITRIYYYTFERHPLAVLVIDGDVFKPRKAYHVLRNR
jgi:hypothetical protein